MISRTSHCTWPGCALGTRGFTHLPLEGQSLTLNKRLCVDVQDLPTSLSFRTGRTGIAISIDLLSPFSLLSQCTEQCNMDDDANKSQDSMALHVWITEHSMIMVLFIPIACASRTHHQISEIRVKLPDEKHARKSSGWSLRITSFGRRPMVAACGAP